MKLTDIDIKEIYIAVDLIQDYRMIDRLIDVQFNW